MTTTMTTDEARRVSPLVTYLKRRFGTRENLAKALGMDARELKALLTQGQPGRLALDQEMGPNGSAPTDNAAQQLRTAIESVLHGCEGGAGSGDVQQILKLLEKYAPMGAGDQEEHDPDLQVGSELRRREERGPEALDCESAAEFLRSKGVDEETIKSAVGMVRDSFPPNALPNGGALGRGAGPGAKFAQKRVGIDERINKRLGIRLPDVGAAAADHAIDRRPVPSAARLDRMFDRFPGMRNIGVHGG